MENWRLAGVEDNIKVSAADSSYTDPTGGGVRYRTVWILWPLPSALPWRV
jgi:hypothetical protein